MPRPSISADYDYLVTHASENGYKYKSATYAAPVHYTPGESVTSVPGSLRKAVMPSVSTTDLHHSDDMRNFSSRREQMLHELAQLNPERAKVFSDDYAHLEATKTVAKRVTKPMVVEKGGDEMVEVHEINAGWYNHMAGTTKEPKQGETEWLNNDLGQWPRMQDMQSADYHNAPPSTYSDLQSSFEKARQRTKVRMALRGKYGNLVSKSEEVPVACHLLLTLIPTSLKDGNTVETYADGTVVTTYPNKTVTRCFKDGVVVQSKPDGTMVIIEQDGREIEMRPDGSTVTTEPDTGTLDGTTVWHKADGSVVSTTSSGAKSTSKNGRTITVSADGQSVESRWAHCGTKVEINHSEGTETFYRPGGVTQVRQPDGTTLQVFPDGQKVIMGRDGSTVPFIDPVTAAAQHKDGRARVEFTEMNIAV